MHDNAVSWQLREAMRTYENTLITGSNPVPTTTFSPGKCATGIRAHFQHKKPMAFPHIAPWKGLTAKVHAKYARGYYRSTWQDAGKH
jgi:hypothetical protein